MVKNLIVFLFVGLVAVGSWHCNKSNTNTSCTVVQPADEEQAILTYNAAKGITGIKDESGLYYEIIEPGTGGTPNLNSLIEIKYRGELTNGTVFDSQTDPTKTRWALRSLIPGWQIAIPKIKKGGKIKMVIPSALGYGCRANGNIPANSILFFEVELVDFY
ncbi:FKBP-type peptidyl-prolyl cis-trans isomerase [Flavihumibacter sp. CACIAM 22H1]|uniref:FKBP-type peptidyl-prolyl cis-trans isomerase n=1 Tax=Flavihumibacter sp. CACIAM 22H1 TaxID=1812911 RepID=UPI0025C20EA9|nr:FKBP-type peptidyl-prolyl cis-trans isomerase [Flavihumibacter sp. CACIAM 22H1]